MELLTEDEDQVIVRTKRSAEVCKYKKGEWGECEELTMVNLFQFSHPGWSRNVLITLLLPSQSQSVATNCKQQKFLNQKFSVDDEGGLAQN